MALVLFAAALFAVVSAQTGQNGTTYCGGATGRNCTTPSASYSSAPTPSSLPCCIDPARCLNGQPLCPSVTASPTASPSASLNPRPSKLPCCVDPSRCTAGQPLCPSPPPMNNTCCAIGTNCTGAVPPCPPPPTNYTTQCCATADCLATGLPPCPSVRPSTPASPSASPSASPTTSSQPTKEVDVSPSELPKPSDEPSPKPSERPQPSQDPTQRPSERPQPSQDPTQRPSERPQPSQDPTQRPSQLPAPSGSVAPTQRPTRRPAASLLIGGTRTPAPSRWPVPANYTPPATFGTINARIELPNANTTAITNPANLQQIAANIACALRQPLETIQINNITTRYKNGTVYVLPFDPTRTTLNSGGAPVCVTAPAPARRLRSLQTAESVTTVDYSIIDPSDNLLALDTTTFNSLVSADPAMTGIAAIVGSSGINAVAPSELDYTAAAPPSSGEPSSQTTASGNNNSVMFIAIGVVLGATVVSIAAASIGIVMRMKSTSAEQSLPPTIQKPTALFITDTNNPLMVSKSKDVTVLMDRTNFQPRAVRV
jgi:hypothetical protein